MGKIESKPKYKSNNTSNLNKTFDDLPLNKSLTSYFKTNNFNDTTTTYSRNSLFSQKKRITNFNKNVKKPFTKSDIGQKMKSIEIINLYTQLSSALNGRFDYNNNLLSSGFILEFRENNNSDDNLYGLNDLNFDLNSWLQSKSFL